MCWWATSSLAVGTSIQRRAFREAVLEELAAYGPSYRDRARRAYRRGDVTDPSGIAMQNNIPLAVEAAADAADAFVAYVDGGNDAE